MPQTNGHGTVTTGVHERPLGELFQELAQDARTLASLELDLAKTELTTKASETGKDVGLLAAGGFVAYGGFLAIVAAIVIGLANFIPAWLSALVVGVVVAVIGYAVIRKGLNDLKKRDFKPAQTIETLKADKDWLQERMR